jgi:Mg-chelatase subunit ChlD
MRTPVTGLLVIVWSAFLASSTGAQTSQPARIVLLVDTSDSMTSHVPFRRGDRTLLTDAALALAAAFGPDERAAVDSFGPAINVSPPALRRDDIAPAAAALNDRPGGTSPLWDALDAAVRSLDGVSGRRGIVVVTDGRTTGNTLSFREILQRLEQARVPVFFLCAERPKQASVADPSVRLRQIASATGGQYYAIRNYSGLARPKPEEIRRALHRAVDAIRKDPPSR